MGIFDKVASGEKIYRTRFPQSVESLFDCDFGDLIPVSAKLAYPGDTWEVGAGAFIRTLPMFAPEMTEISVRFRTFFIPLNSLASDAQDIIKGYDDDGKEYSGTFAPAVGTPQKYGFWDYLGIPIGINFDKFGENVPAKYFLKAYKKVWNDWYRFPLLQSEIDIDSDDETILKVSYGRDYFTSCTLAPQLGDPIAVPVGGSNWFDLVVKNRPDTSFLVYGNGTGGNNPALCHKEGGLYPEGTYQTERTGIEFNGNLAFTINDWRENLALQSISERLNRCGFLFPDYLKATFGVAPADDVLRRPVYLGGGVSPIVVSEVVQTGATQGDSPQGNLAGKGLGLSNSYIKPYFVKQHGIIMTLMSITPNTLYMGQGVDREMTVKSHYEFYDPALQTIGERAVRNGELFIDSNNVDDINDKAFGFQPYATEYKCRRSHVCGEFRDTLAYWHLGRKFANTPVLDGEFITVDVQRDELNRNFTSIVAKPFYCHVYMDNHATRPMIKHATPFNIHNINGGLV